MTAVHSEALKAPLIGWGMGILAQLCLWMNHWIAFVLVFLGGAADELMSLAR